MADPSQLKRKKSPTEPVQPPRKSRRIAKLPPDSTDEKTDVSSGKASTSTHVPGSNSDIPLVGRPRTRTKKANPSDPGPKASNNAEETKQSPPKPGVHPYSLGRVAGTTTHEAIETNKEKRTPEVAVEEGERARENLPTEETSKPAPYPKSKATTKTKPLPVKTDRKTRSSTRRQAKTQGNIDSSSGS